MRRYVGRQLTRVGALCQRLRLLAAAELGYRLATRLHPDPAWYVRLAKIQEARDHWGAAEAAYARTLEVAKGGSHQATAHYRQGRARVRRKDWDGAEASFAAAVALRPELVTWHAHRAENHERRGDWPAAAASYQEAVRLEPDQPEWRARLVRGHLKTDRPDLAVAASFATLASETGGSVAALASETGGSVAALASETGGSVAALASETEGSAVSPRPTHHPRLDPLDMPAPGRSGLADHPSLQRSLLTAYQAVGDWPAAARLLRELVDRQPDDYGLRMQLVECLQQLYLVPFALDHRGEVRTHELASGALAEAIRHLRHLTDQAPQHAGAPHKLGLLYERSGQLTEAAGGYRLAMRRLAEVDAWWCHRAAHEWAFRLDYVSGTREGRAARRVAPAGADRPAQPAGFFDAVMFRHGLQLSGILLPGQGPLVDVQLDDQLLKRVRVDSSTWRPVLRYDLTHGLLGEFPERSLLTVLAGGRPLVTVDGAAALEIRVPGGTGAVGKKLAAGHSPTKKGGWPRTGKALATRQERYLDVYERAKELLDAQGRQLFLCYGTLLGCHREGRFIPGDDDFDVSYVSRAGDPGQFRQECRRLALGLLREGLDVNLSINGRMFKVGLDGIWLDITPMWFYKGRAWAFDAHDLSVDAFEPVQVTKFLHREVYVPRDPEAFLADAYGPQWKTPQPEFRYYRSKADDQVLSQMWAKPSEVRAMARQAEAERERNPAAGEFVGVGYPGYPGFSWLTVPDGPRPPAD